MKHHIHQLQAISKKKTRLILGLMSGTSLDGLDIALCAISGAEWQTKLKVLRFKTIAYDEAFKAEIRQVFAKKGIDFQHLVLLNVRIATRHGELVNQCLQEWKIAPEEVDLIASHGQTVYHAPRVFHGLADYPNATLQIGDGDHLARKTGIITISDFRQKHIAAGGEGAPLALYGDYFLFSKKGEERYLLNIGGIANFSYLPSNLNPAQAFATDTGPGNTLLDAFARQLFGVPFDENGRLASNGRVDERLLEAMKTETFFAKPLPKTIGPELFSVAWANAAFAQQPKGNPNPYDLMATLTQLTIDTIAEAISRTRLATNSTGKTTIGISGGGAHNPLIINGLNNKLSNVKIVKMEKLGIDGDAKEAVLFALLANETIAGRVGEGMVLGGVPMVGMGKISFPA